MDAESLRKAAILINALDSQTADALLDQMSESQSAAVRNAVMNLYDVDPQEQEEVIEAFLASQRGESPQPGEPQPAAPELVEDAPPEPLENGRLFQFLHQVDAASVHAFLAPEHPQTVAIVLAHLPPRQASNVLRLLASDTQSDVLRRIARLEGADVQVLRDVEEEMKRVFAARSFHSGDAHGVSSLQAILEATDEEERGHWLKDIEQFDPLIAKRIQDPAARFAAPALARFPRLTKATTPPPEDKQEPQFEGAEEQAGPIEVERKPIDAAPKHDGAGQGEPAAGRDGVQNDKADETDFERVEWPTLDGAAQREHRDAPPVGDSQLAQSTMNFESLYDLDDTALALVLKRTPGKVALVALAGAKRAFVERLMEQLPADAAKSLNDRIEAVGPVRLKDIELAQQKVMQIAEQLAEEGQIELPRPSGFAAAA